MGRLALAANFDSGVGLLWPNLGAPHSPSEFYMVEFSTPTHYVDISSTLKDKVLSSFNRLTLPPPLLSLLPSSPPPSSPPPLLPLPPLPPPPSSPSPPPLLPSSPPPLLLPSQSQGSNPATAIFLYLFILFFYFGYYYTTAYLFNTDRRLRTS